MDLVFDSLTSTITLAFFSIFLFYFLFLYRSSKASHSKEAPIVQGAWPILGHLQLLLGSQGPHRTLGALADTYGPLFTIKLGSRNALVLSNWEMAEECFTKIDLAISDRPTLETTQHMTYNGAMFFQAPYGPYLREIKKITNLEILSNHQVEKLQPYRVMVVRTSIKELYNVWCRKENNESSKYLMVEVKQWFTQLNIDLVLPLLVGKRYFGSTSVIDKEEVEICVKAIKEMLRLMGVFTVGDALPFLKWFDFGGHVKAMKKASKEMDKIIGDLLEEHQRKRSLSEKEVDGDHQDFMDVMLSLLDGTTIEGFDSDTVIKATILTLIAGGVDTTSVTLIWAMCLLLENPLVIEKAQEELDIQVGKERCVKESDIDKLVYLQAIVKETLRLCPPAPLSGPREFTENSNLGGYDVKKGTRLIMNLWKIHTDLKVWLEPLEFKPERFLTTHKGVDVKGHHFELLPFGSGRRICPGISYGLQMVHLSLASFLHSFEISKASAEPIDMTEAFGITNHKATPLEILIKPRLPSNCYEAI